MKPYLKYLLLLLTLPVFFLLHGVNENYGLLPFADSMGLLFKYILVTILVFSGSSLLIRQPSKAYLVGFILLLVYFFFGAIKDLLPFHIPYRLLLPLLVLLLSVIVYYFKKAIGTFLKGATFITYLMSLLLIVETGSFLFNYFSHAENKQDFGDVSNVLLKTVLEGNAETVSPDIFWLVFDMYPSSSSLKRGWQYENPLDSTLIKKGFYIAKEARSNYNYTHFSLVSTLDMNYLPEFKEGSVVTAKDQVRGNYSLYETNVSRFLLNKGYDIKNFSIYDIKDAPTQGIQSFKNNEKALIDHQTVVERLKADIGWNFLYGWNKTKHETDSIFNRQSVIDVDSTYRLLLAGSNTAIKTSARSPKPVFFLLHVLLPHEPYIYQENGMLLNKGLNSDTNLFIGQLKYTNKIIESLVDTILQSRKERKTIILLQGDHGYKYEVTDPRFQTESCNILYAVYNSRQEYTSWYSSISSVNSFRILLNETFKTGFPILPDTTFRLEYRQYKKGE